MLIKRFCLFIIIINLFIFRIQPVLSQPTTTPTITPDPTRIPPKRRPTEAKVELEWVEIQSACETDKLCIEGQLYNRGRKPAYRVHLKVELGGTKYIRPRTFLYKKVEQKIMYPGDRQTFFIQIDRKVPYKRRKKVKFFEVGKYNFKIVPQWSTHQRRK